MYLTKKSNIEILINCNYTHFFDFLAFFSFFTLRPSRDSDRERPIVTFLKIKFFHYFSLSLCFFFSFRGINRTTNLTSKCSSKIVADAPNLTIVCHKLEKRRKNIFNCSE